MVPLRWNPHHLHLRHLRLPHALQPVHHDGLCRLLRVWNVLGAWSQCRRLHALPTGNVWRRLVHLLRLLRCWHLLGLHGRERVSGVLLWPDLRRRRGGVRWEFCGPGGAPGAVLQFYPCSLCTVPARLHLRRQRGPAKSMSWGLVVHNQHIHSLHQLRCRPIHRHSLHHYG
jgi:hypothetical protein